MDILSMAAGAFGVGIAYFLYLIATKGLPAALAWIKSKWNAGKADLVGLQGDVDWLKHGFETLRADVEALKGAQSTPAAAPAPPTPTAG